MSYSNPTDRAWEKLSQVAVPGAVYDSGERLPHPKCLKGTRVNLLEHIYNFLDRSEQSQLIWLHGTAGVGKSAVAFTVAERMRGLKASEVTTVEKRLAGTFFFSRTNTNRRTTGYLFATLAYQLARNFSCVRTDVSKAIIENPAILEPNSSLRDQMEELFLRPLRQLRQKRPNCSPLSFIIDALDECISEAELAELISLLGQALRESDLPQLQILLTSRSEAHVREAMEEEEVHPLVCEIPVKSSGDGLPDIISLDGADVDNDIYVFLNHSFTSLRRRRPDFPQPTRDQLVQLATRAGRRFIVASTMMKFIDDGDTDPRDRLDTMLHLTSELTSGMDVYKLYDLILSTCADPDRAYMHLSVVATLADPLPASQISKLLGPGRGYDAESTLVQLRSVMDIPTDSSLPVNIYHSSIRDYVSDPSNCSLPNLQYIAPHSLLAYSSLRLMIDEMPASTALLDGLIELKRHSEVISSKDPRKLRESLAFVVQPLEPLQVLSCLLWVRGYHTPVLQYWLETPDGRAWLVTTNGVSWLENDTETDGLDGTGTRWLQTEGGHGWLETENGKGWLQNTRWLRTKGGENWLQTQVGKHWLQTEDAKKWIDGDTCKEMHEWVDTEAGRNWLQTQAGQSWLQTTYCLDWLAHSGWLATQAGREWLQTQVGTKWLQTEDAKQYWLLSTREGGDWLQTQCGGDWLQTQNGGDWMLIERDGEWMPIRVWNQEEGSWLQTPGGRAWLQTQSIQDWLQTSRGRCWLREQDELDWLLPDGGKDWLKTEGGSEWLENRVGKVWLRTKSGKHWLETEGGNGWLETEWGNDWLKTEDGTDWLQRRGGKDWLETEGGKNWLQRRDGKEWVQTEGGQDWVRTQGCVETEDCLKPRDDRLDTQYGQGSLQVQAAQEWLRSSGPYLWLGSQDRWDWLQTQAGNDWLQTQASHNWLKSWRAQQWLNSRDGQGWLWTQYGRDWLNSRDGKGWLWTQHGQDWLNSRGGHVWLWTQHGRDWLNSRDGQEWLWTQHGRDWLQTQVGQEWLTSRDAYFSLDTQDGWDWLQTQAGKDWLQTQSVQGWLKPSGKAKDWLCTRAGGDWLATQGGRDWLATNDGKDWLQTESGRDWLQIQSGRDWLQTQDGRDWLQTQDGRDWLQTQGGETWLQTESGRDWLQSPRAEAWPFMGVWVIIVEFWSALEAVSQYPIIPELPCLPAFQVIQHLKSLPDFLMFPVFLALRHHDNSAFSSPQDHLPDVEIIRAMKAFVNVANKGRVRGQSASDALKYACHNWAIHLAQAPRPWDAMLGRVFHSFWYDHVLYWLEMQWCSKGLRACLAVLYEGEKLAREYLSQTR